MKGAKTKGFDTPSLLLKGKVGWLVLSALRKQIVKFLWNMSKFILRTIIFNANNKDTIQKIPSQCIILKSPPS
jgi:hypothetical protein